MVFKKEGSRLIGQAGGEIIVIEPFGKDCFRFRSTMNRDLSQQNWTLLPQPEVDTRIIVEKNNAIIENGNLAAVISANGCVKYIKTIDGSELLEELWVDQRTQNAPVRKARNYKWVGGDCFEVDLYLRAYDDEKFYGMGHYAIGRLNLKGCVLELAQKNTQISIPFVLSTRGYGFIWNNPAIGKAEFAYNHTCWHANATREIDYVIFYGSEPAEIIKKYGELTGRPPILPEWATGLWQSRARYRTQDEVLSVAKEYRRRGLPLSVIVIDFFHWPNQGDWEFDPRYWPDPKAMVDELHRLGIEVMVSFWPTVDIKSKHYLTMVEKGLLVKTERGAPIQKTFRGITAYVDFTNPESAKFVWEKVKEGYIKHGIKRFWLDVAEPEIYFPGFGYENISHYDYDNLRYYLGNGATVSNIYPFYYAKCFWEGLKQEKQEDVVNLIRSAWIGSQRLGVVVWSGDIPSSFESLRREVKANLNLAIAGITWWTTDIGGFYGGNPEDPHFRELVVRWFQYGVFSPILRLHGLREPYPKNWYDSQKVPVYELTGGPNEVWSFGEEVYEILKQLLLLRERLKPYIIDQLKRAHYEGIPVTRPLFFDFPGDEICYDVEDQYMFGPDILVAPVVWEGARSRKVYLPKGARWTNPYTGEEYEGGQWVEVSAPLEVIPVFLKNRAQIPICE